MDSSNESGPGGSGSARTVQVDDANAEASRVSIQILDIIAVKGKVSEPGPQVSECSGKDSTKYFRMRHAWSLSHATKSELSDAMVRLKENLPEKGWNIVEYGPNNSRAKTLELTADNKEKQYSLNVEFWDERQSDGKSMLLVNVVSDCFRVPEGQTVDRY
jgi:hypothetical protein